MLVFVEEQQKPFSLYAWNGKDFLDRMDGMSIVLLKKPWGV